MRLIVFDIDGTLLQSTATDEACFVDAFRQEFGIEAIDTDWMQYPDVTDPAAARAILEFAWDRAPAPGELARLQRRFVQLLDGAARSSADVFVPTAGAAELLAWLRGRMDWAGAIATGGWRASAELKLAWSGLDITGLPLASADDDVTREGIVREAIDRARVFTGKAVEPHCLVGDAPWDARTADRLGIPFVGVAPDGQSGALIAAGARAVMRDFTDMEDVIRLFSELD